MFSRLQRRRSNLQDLGRLSKSCPAVDDPAGQQQDDWDSNSDTDSRDSDSRGSSASLDQRQSESSEEISPPISRAEKQLARQSLRRAKQREVEQKRNHEENKISMDDYLGKQTQFRMWLQEEQKKEIKDLSSPKRKTYFKMFVRLWNKHHLHEKFYESRLSHHLAEDEVPAVEERKSPKNPQRTTFSLMQNSPALDPTIFPHSIDLSSDTLGVGTPSPFSTFGKAATPSSTPFRFSAESEPVSKTPVTRKKDMSRFRENKENATHFSMPLYMSDAGQLRTATISPHKKMMSRSQDRSLDRTVVSWSPQGPPKLNPVTAPRCPSPFQRQHSHSTARCAQSAPETSAEREQSSSLTGATSTQLGVSSSALNGDASRVSGAAVGSNGNGTGSNGIALELTGNELGLNGVLSGLTRNGSGSNGVTSGLNGNELGLNGVASELISSGSGLKETTSPRLSEHYYQVKDFMESSSPTYVEIPFGDGSDEVQASKETRRSDGDAVDKPSTTTAEPSAKQVGRRQFRRRSRSVEDAVYAVPSKDIKERNWVGTPTMWERELSMSPPPVPPKRFDPHVEGLGVPYFSPSTAEKTHGQSNPEQQQCRSDKQDKGSIEGEKKAGGFFKGRFPWFRKKTATRRRSRSCEVLSRLPSESVAQKPSDESRNGGDPFPLVEMERSPTFSRRVITQSLRPSSKKSGNLAEKLNKFELTDYASSPRRGPDQQTRKPDSAERQAGRADRTEKQGDMADRAQRQGNSADGADREKEKPGGIDRHNSRIDGIDREAGRADRANRVDQLKFQMTEYSSSPVRLGGNPSPNIMAGGFERRKPLHRRSRSVEQFDSSSDKCMELTSSGQLQQCGLILVDGQSAADELFDNQAEQSTARCELYEQVKSETHNSLSNLVRKIQQLSTPRTARAHAAAPMEVEESPQSLGQDGDVAGLASENPLQPMSASPQSGASLDLPTASSGQHITQEQQDSASTMQTSLADGAEGSIPSFFEQHITAEFVGDRAEEQSGSKEQTEGEESKEREPLTSKNVPTPSSPDSVQHRQQPLLLREEHVTNNRKADDVHEAEINRTERDDNAPPSIVPNLHTGEIPCYQDMVRRLDTWREVAFSTPVATVKQVGISGQCLPLSSGRRAQRRRSKSVDESYLADAWMRNRDTADLLEGQTRAEDGTTLSTFRTMLNFTAHTFPSEEPLLSESTDTRGTLGSSVLSEMDKGRQPVATSEGPGLEAKDLPCSGQDMEQSVQPQREPATPSRSHHVFKIGSVPAQPAQLSNKGPVSALASKQAAKLHGKTESTHKQPLRVLENIDQPQAVTYEERQMDTEKHPNELKQLTEITEKPQPSLSKAGKLESVEMQPAQTFTQAVHISEAPQPAQAPQPVHVSETPQPDHVSETPQPVHVSETPQPAHVSETPHPAHVSETPQSARVSNTLQPAHVSKTLQPGHVSETPQPAHVSEAPQSQPTGPKRPPPVMAKPVVGQHMTRPTGHHQSAEPEAATGFTAILQKFGSGLKSARPVNRRRSRSVGDVSALGEKGGEGQEAGGGFANVRAFWDRLRAGGARERKEAVPLQRKPSTMKRLQQQLYGNQSGEKSSTGGEADGQSGSGPQCVQQWSGVTMQQPVSDVPEMATCASQGPAAVQALEGRQAENRVASTDMPVQKSPYITVRRQSSRKRSAASPCLSSWEQDYDAGPSLHSGDGQGCGRLTTPKPDPSSTETPGADGSGAPTGQTSPDTSSKQQAAASGEHSVSHSMETPTARFKRYFSRAVASDDRSPEGTVRPPVLSSGQKKKAAVPPKTLPKPSVRPAVHSQQQPPVKRGEGDESQSSPVTAASSSNNPTIHLSALGRLRKRRSQEQEKTVPEKMSTGEQDKVHTRPGTRSTPSNQRGVSVKGGKAGSSHSPRGSAVAHSPTQSDGTAISVTTITLDSSDQWDGERSSLLNNQRRGKVALTAAGRPINTQQDALPAGTQHSNETHSQETPIDKDTSSEKLSADRQTTGRKESKPAASSIRRRSSGKSTPRLTVCRRGGAASGARRSSGKGTPRATQLCKNTRDEQRQQAVQSDALSSDIVGQKSEMKGIRTVPNTVRRVSSSREQVVMTGTPASVKRFSSVNGQTQSSRAKRRSRDTNGKDESQASHAKRRSGDNKQTPIVKRSSSGKSRRQSGRVNRTDSGRRDRSGDTPSRTGSLRRPPQSPTFVRITRHLGVPQDEDSMEEDSFTDHASELRAAAAALRKHAAGARQTPNKQTGQARNEERLDHPLSVDSKAPGFTRLLEQTIRSNNLRLVSQEGTPVSGSTPRQEKDSSTAHFAMETDIDACKEESNTAEKEEGMQQVIGQREREEKPVGSLSTLV